MLPSPDELPKDESIIDLKLAKRYSWFGMSNLIYPLVN